MKLSSPDVGSSRNITAGLLRTSDAIESLDIEYRVTIIQLRIRVDLLLSPPDIPPIPGAPMRVSTHFARPNRITVCGICHTQKAE